MAHPHHHHRLRTAMALLVLVPQKVVAVNLFPWSSSATQNNKDKEKEAPATQDEYKRCGVYLAQSTLPGTGIGMFAGRDYEPGEALLEVGDHNIPIVSLPQHQGHDVFFLWDEYTWNPEVLRAEHEGVGTMVASPGFGGKFERERASLEEEKNYGFCDGMMKMSNLTHLPSPTTRFP
jgi:hypothetical protein